MNRVTTSVREKSELGKIRAIDIAPTVARILGIELPTAEGKPLEKPLGD